MSDHNDGGAAFPVHPNMGNEQLQGMSMRQCAAIKLRVPESGTDWLDDMIRKAKRDELAGLAMQGLLAHGATMVPNGEHSFNVSEKDQQAIATIAYIQADAMLAAREAKR